jgi:hypothetical protein
MGVSLQLSTFRGDNSGLQSTNGVVKGARSPQTGCSGSLVGHKQLRERGNRRDHSAVAGSGTFQNLAQINLDGAAIFSADKSARDWFSQSPYDLGYR